MERGARRCGLTTTAAFQAYFEAEIKQPFATWAELEETCHFVTTYAPHLFEKTYTEARGAHVQAHTIPAAEATTGEGLSRGEDRKSEKSKNKLSSEKVEARAAQNGVSPPTQKKLDKLTRLHPDLLALIQAGQLSVNRACIKAGYVKEATPLQLLQRAWAKASAVSRPLSSHSAVPEHRSGIILFAAVPL